MAIDHGLQPARAGTLVLWVAVLVVVAGVTAWLAIMRHRTMTWVRMDAAFRTIRLVSDQAMRMGHTLGRQGLAGEIAAIGLNDSWVIGRSLTATGPGVGAVVTYLVTAVLLLRVSPLLAAVILVGVPVLAVVVGPALSRLTRAQLPYREQQAALTDQSLDIAGGLRVLNALGGKALFRERFDRHSAVARDLGYRVGAVVSVIEAMTIALPTLYLAAVVWLAARLAAAGTITIGELVAVYGYAAVLIVPVTSFIEGATDFSQAMVPARRVIKFLALTDDAERVTEPAPAGPAPLVDTVTGVHVDPGSFTAVVTGRQADARGIVDRLAGLEPGGRWDGRPTTRMPADEVRDRLLVADHDAALFTGRLSANVAGRSAVFEPPNNPGQTPSAAVRQAVTVASADDIVDGLAGEWAGLLATGGTNLSGGQRQRIRLARAVAADPEVLLAVDPTSALDSHTEATVASRLRFARRGRTTVVTTTSPLVLEQVSQIQLVIDNRVVASSTHQQLLGDPRYYHLVVRGDEEQAS
ncbi:MAG: ABC transporter ATP-binding protein/permease [Actinomycetota bacterium]|nr:ABC transporter ATP-binding protein/permease [Actinomycetota bacterium]